MRRREPQDARAIRCREHVPVGECDRFAAPALPARAEHAPAAGVGLESAELEPRTALPRLAALRRESGPQKRAAAAHLRLEHADIVAIQTGEPELLRLRAGRRDPDALALACR